MLPLRPFLLLGLALSAPALAVSYQTRLEKAQWQVEGTTLECRLSQPVENYGVGEFVRRGGEGATFRLRPNDRWQSGGGSAVLVAAAPVWRPEQGDINLGQVRLSSDEYPLRSSASQASALIDGLLQGLGPTIRQSGSAGQAEIRLMPVNFTDAYRRYQECTAKLIPVNFDQLRQLQLNFGQGDELTDVAEGKLGILFDYMKADPADYRFDLAGHSDNSGDRLTNREISRRRALAVKNYLINQGVPEDHITLRFYGDQFPLVRNDTAAHRAQNRRVTLKVSRQPLSAEPPAKADAPAPSAPPAGQMAGQTKPTS